MGKSLDIKWSEDNKTVFLSGCINQESPLEELCQQFKEATVVDLKGITHINSSGVMNWLKAFRTTKHQITFAEVSMVMVEQFNLVPEFTKKEKVTQSIFVPYLCDHCGNEDMFIWNLTEDITSFLSANTATKTHTCTACTKTIEPLIEPESYLRFLRKKSDKS